MTEAADGTLLRLEVGPVAHGGFCVARHEGRVVFVRHALPGETVLARPDEGSAPTDRFWRADAVEVLTASPDRVEPRCAVSGPGGCGGCDWQHASLDAQRRGKADVVREQLRRLARVEWPDLVVEPVPGDADGLGWRTRVRFAVDRQGRAGLRRHRSHDVVPVERCPIAHPGVNGVGVGTRRWSGAEAVEVVVPSADGRALVVVEAVDGGRADVPPLAADASVARRGRDGLTRLRGRTWVEEVVPGAGDGERRFRITGTGFWQVHPGAATTLVAAVLEAARPRPGERAVDLYSGVGLFSAALAEAVGPDGAVLGVESEARACADARRSLHDLPQVSLAEGRVERVLGTATAVAPWAGSADVVVLDPPRSGAGKDVVRAVAALGPRVVVYVACDPAALARDVAVAAGLGYDLVGLRAFDCFPLTHHVECVATLAPREIS